jgi:hypothetical protein
MKEWHIKFVGLICIINQYNVLIGSCKLDRLWVCNEEVPSPVFWCGIDFEMNLFVFKVLDQGIICRKSMSLFSFKRGVEVVYIVRLKWDSSCLAKVSHCLTWFNT